MQYRLATRTTATAATLSHATAVLWAPTGGANGLMVREIHVVNTTATNAQIAVARASQRGVQTSSVTPDIDNDTMRSLDRPSNAVIDTAWSTQPTIELPALDRWITAQTIGAGKIWVFSKRIHVTINTGLAIVNAEAVATNALDVTFVWDERE